MSWKFFIGSSILAAGLMLKVAPVWAVAAGLVLAGLVNWGRHRRSMPGAGRRP